MKFTIVQHRVLHNIYRQILICDYRGELLHDDGWYDPYREAKREGMCQLDAAMLKH